MVGMLFKTSWRVCFQEPETTPTLVAAKPWEPASLEGTRCPLGMIAETWLPSASFLPSFTAPSL